MIMTEDHIFNVNESNIRLDQYLSRMLPDYSRSKIQSFIKLGQVKINGKSVKPSLLLNGFETINCSFSNVIKKDNLLKQKMDLDIIYEDDSIAVINKPSGLVVHPGSGNYSNTLLNGILYHFDSLSRTNSFRPGIVHRLDKETSGVIIIAKNDKVHDNLSKQFSKRVVKKEYRALVWGLVNDEGNIDKPIGRHPKQRKLFTVVESGGKESITKYKILNHFAPFSWIKLYPKTGRTHQLRVHMKSIGHPIFFDNAYGGGLKYSKSFHIKYIPKINKLTKNLNRVALHAYSIEINHPLNNKKIKFTAPVPQDLENSIKEIEFEEN